MRSDDDLPAPHEVVIVRRRRGTGDDDHHGGAWKIAFADLMTAMMAFFLVMWLVNVSDKEKIQQIATYFNPLKLNAKRPTTKGVEEEEMPKAAPSAAGPASPTAEGSLPDRRSRNAAADPGGDGDLEEGAERIAEEELFNDPYGVLARLASEATVQSETATESQDRLSGSSDSFSNPFEPFAEQRSPRAEATPSEHEQMPLGGREATLDLEKPLEVPPEIADAGKADSPDVVGGGDAHSEKAQEQAQTINAELSKALAGLSLDQKPAIDVRLVNEGVLIVLTDDFRFGMFASASAEPRPETVVVMEKVAKVLGGQQGRIVVRGHTDARPFRTERNNNWRLSMDRAQMAYYMLARGGIAEQRFESIEGRADRDLRNTADPNAAENRRIEIMLRPAP